MLKLKSLLPGLLLGTAFLVPLTAQAQIAIIRSPGTPNWGPTFSRPGFGGVGWPAGFGSTMYGTNMAPFGGVPGVSNNYYNPGWNYQTPYNMNAFNRSGPVIFPGFAASDPPRARPTLHPAIPTPSKEIIAAALGDDDANRAFIEIRLPSAAAQVMLDGAATRQTGLSRTFKTPPLNPKSQYSFRVDVTWQEGGQTRTLRRDITLKAGETSRLDVSQGK